MNLYVPLSHSNLFLQILKDFKEYDDYSLDGEKLGKQKIIFNKVKDKNQFFRDIFPHLPESSFIVFSGMKSEKDYMFCAGTIHIDNLPYLEKMGANPSIYTKLGTEVRVNVWIANEQLEKVHASGVIRELTTIKGKVVENPYFVFDTNHVDRLLSLVSQNSTEYIIKTKKLFVNLSLQFFCEHYKELSNAFEKVEIVDKEDF